MISFLLILAGLVAFNFVLLKFSMQSVNTDKKKSKETRSRITPVSDQSKSEEIPNAA